MCVQALICTVLVKPVDPEVEDVLAKETTVVRTFGEDGGKVRPPCGYGLLQAKEEARKVRALRSLMKVGEKHIQLVVICLQKHLLETHPSLVLSSTVCASCCFCCWC